MKVRIEDAAIFDCKDAAVYTELQRLLMRAALGQHLLDVLEPEAVLVSDFMQVAVAANNRTEWEEVVTRTMGAGAFDVGGEGPVALVSEVGGVPAGHRGFGVAAREAGAWSERPLRVVLENSRDGVLVSLGAKATATGRIEQAFVEGWIHLDGRGGCGEVKRTVESSKALDRLFVIIDSDRDAVGAEASAQATLIKQLCDSGGIPACILERREIENYVPAETWKALVARRAAKRSVGGVEARTVLVWRVLLRALVDERTGAARHGADALKRVRDDVERRASRPLQKKNERQLLSEWLNMPLAEKAVDDLKVRFGEGVAAKGVEAISDAAFALSALDAAAAEEIRGIASKLEEWL